MANLEYTKYNPGFFAIVGRMLKDLPAIGTGLFYLALGVWSAFGIASFFPCPWGEWPVFFEWGQWALYYSGLSLVVFWYLAAKDSLIQADARRQLTEMDNIERERELKRQHTSRHDCP